MCVRNTTGARTDSAADAALHVIARDAPAPFESARAAGWTGDPWFAVWTRSRHEAGVHRELTRKGVESFLPVVPRWSRWKDRRKRIEFPLFPGYCFARFDPVASLPVLSCVGVVAVVSFDGRPASIPVEEIESLRTLVDSELQFDPCPLVKTGDKVEVVAGPLKGVVGRLTRKDQRSRLVIAVELVGQGVSVDVDAADVRPF